MADSEGMIVPVTVGKKQNVKIPEKNSLTSVLYINNSGQFHMVPLNIAQSMVKKHKGNIIDKSHKDYMKGYKAAIGYNADISTEKILQQNGKVSSIVDNSRLNVQAMLKKETAEVEIAQKEAGAK